MKTAGIIAEYNPFHNGHMYHIEKTREISGADVVVVAVSGNFVQRGEPAFADKFSRAKAALSGGADLVVELPCVFACRSAEKFASGGVKLLEALECDYISFGTESESVENLQKAADFLKENSAAFSESLSKLLKEGKSYPRALSEAFGDNITATPNNTLAIEYLKANTSMKPIAVPRKGSLHDGAGSASDIRSGIGNGANVEKLIPVTTSEILKTAKTADYKIFESLVLYKLRTSSREQIKNTPDVGEGLENRIYDAALKSADFTELLENIKTKRYTMARIRRILTNLLIGITKDDPADAPEYIRVLGMNKKGAEILSHLKKTSKLPIITKTADAPKSRMLDIDICASDIYSVISHSSGASDFTTSPVIMN